MPEKKIEKGQQVGSPDDAGKVTRGVVLKVERSFNTGANVVELVYVDWQPRP